MSVSYANALAKRIDASFLCCTRKEGLLKKQLAPEVGYLFLNKKNVLDPKAFFKFRRFVKVNKIDLIQAHSSSWFLALMVKLSLPRVKLVWHDHYGRDLLQRKTGLLKPASKFFDGIIAVNKDLEHWSEKNLKCKEVKYIRNFLPEIIDTGKKVGLKGENSFKLICVANFRPQKDHLNLLQAFRKVLEKQSETTLHLIGKDEQDDYSEEIREFIDVHNLNEVVFIYGELENVPAFLEQADLGVLPSASEGLPVALLEYGRAGLPVVCTDVGDCAEVIGCAGILVPPNNSTAFSEAISTYLLNNGKRTEDAASFHQKVNTAFSEETVIPDLIRYFEELRQ